MANILDRYGIKEVADVVFYDILANGDRGAPVLFLDTLKVSTIEQTGEQAEARGGKGNPPLIIWDYGKEINVTLEDALFSAKSMAIMFGSGKVDAIQTVTRTVSKNYITATVEGNAAKFKVNVSGVDLVPTTYKLYDGEGHELTATVGTGNKIEYKYTPKNADGTDGTAVTTTLEFITFDAPAEGGEIVISANSFPGTYYVTGDTYARSEITGDDEMFQFIIQKAKVQSENTITLEAEGDPSVFNMSLRVLRPADGKMMKLVKYNINATTGTEDEGEDEE